MKATGPNQPLKTGDIYGMIICTASWDELRCSRATHDQVRKTAISKGHCIKLSARNVLPGTVTKVTEGAVNAEVHLALRNGDMIVSIITKGSVDALGLAEGKSASAIIKASWAAAPRSSAS